MAISYEPAQPFSGDISYGYGATLQNNEDAPRLQRARELAAAAGGGGGGGRGYGGGVQQTQGDIQDAINNRDANRLKGDMFNAQQNTEVQGDVFRQQAAALGQRDRFELQSQLQEAELSQQEKIRLARMKNAVGEVSADPSLSDSEKSDMILQLKTGIDPYENRLKKSRLAAEQLQKEAMADQKMGAAAINQKILEGMGKSAEQRTSWIPNPVALAEIAADMKANLPPTIPGPGGVQVPISPEMIAEMAKQEAIKQGLGSQMYVNPDGTLHPLSGKEAGEKGGAGGKGKKDDGSDHPLGISAETYQKERDRIESSIDKQATLMREGEDGIKRPLYPSLQTEEGRDAAMAKKLKDAGFPSTLAEFNAARQKPEESDSRSGYKTVFGKKDGKPAAAAGGKPAEGKPEEKPFEWDKPGTDTQKQTVAKFDALKTKVEKELTVQHPRGRQALSALTEIKSLLSLHGSVDNMKNPADKDRFNAAVVQVVEALKPENQGGPPAAAATAPAEKPLTANEMGGSVRRQWNKVTDAVMSAAPPFLK